MDSKKIYIVALCILSAFIILGYAFSVKAGSIDENKLYKVAYAIDGDTIVIEQGRRLATIRMLGLDTPETVDPREPVQCYGEEASNATKEILTGRLVKLKKNPNRELKDRYGRYLLYVYRDDGLFVNGYLISNGFAREYTYGSPYIFRDDFRKKESEAKHDKRGLWGSCLIKKSS